MDPINPRRNLLGAARKFLLDNVSLEPDPHPSDDIPRLTFSALEKIRMSRSRERILQNLETMYREAFERAKAAGEENQLVGFRHPAGAAVPPDPARHRGRDRAPVDSAGLPAPYHLRQS